MTTAHRVRERQGKGCGWMLAGPPQPPHRRRSCGRALRRGRRAAVQFGTLAAPWSVRGTRFRALLSGLGPRRRWVRPAGSGLGVRGGGSPEEPAVPWAAASPLGYPGPGGARPGRPSSPGSRGWPCLWPLGAVAACAECARLERAELRVPVFAFLFFYFSSNQLLEV